MGLPPENGKNRNGYVRAGIAALAGIIVSAQIAAGAAKGIANSESEIKNQRPYTALEKNIGTLIGHITQSPETNTYVDHKSGTTGYRTILLTHGDNGIVDTKYSIVDKVGKRIEICLSDRLNYFNPGESLTLVNIKPIDLEKVECFGTDLNLDGTLMHPKLNQKSEYDLSGVVNVTNRIFQDRSYELVRGK